MTDTAVQDSPLLSRFLRMAVVAGVESAVQIHIDRGDDLDARDAAGKTPLMLAAARDKASICSLLLIAGADATLLDPSGRDALAIAQAAGAREAVRAIESARPLAAPSDTGAEASERAGMTLGEGAPTVDGNQDGFGVTTSAEDASAHGSRWNSIPSELDDGFDLTGWEAEEDLPPPDGDPALSAASVEVQAAISGHQPIDTSTDWDDSEALLPDRAAPLPRTDDAEARERLRLVLLRAIREGSVPRSTVEDLTLGDDGEPDQEASALLGMVLNDLGCETDERFEYSAPHETFEVFVAPDEDPDEEDSVAGAMEFIDDLAGRRNEPLRIYQREFQQVALLTADAEVALAQAMERGVEKSLDALALWPEGIGALLDAAAEVGAGAKPLRWLSSVSQVEPEDDEPGAPADSDATAELPNSIGEDEDDEPPVGPDVKQSIDDLNDFLAKVQTLSGMPVGSSRDDAEWKSCRVALASLGLSRSFLLGLSDTGAARSSASGRAFAQSMSIYRCARDEMTVANLKLVQSIAKKYLFSGQPLDDLLQEGNIGLMKAVDRYDWRRGFKFSTYATWWIRQQVGRYVADKGKTIRLPVHIYEKTQRIAQASRAFESKNGRAPTVDEIAAMAGLPAKKVLALARSTLEPVAIDEQDVDALIAMDAKDDFIARDPMDIAQDAQLAGLVDRFLGTLKRKEEKVLRMRFGVGIQDSMTLEEIGERLDVTRERIRQIEAKALRLLKHPARLDQLRRELNAELPTARGTGADASGDADDEADDSPNAAIPLEREVHRIQRPRGSQPTALDKLLDQARSDGFTVEDDRNGKLSSVWVYITSAPDNRSRTLVRKLLELGFASWPGKGYWR